MRLTVSNKVLEAQAKRDSQDYVPVSQRIKKISGIEKIRSVCGYSGNC